MEDSRHCVSCLQLHRPWVDHCESRPVLDPPPPQPPAGSQGHPALKSTEELLCVFCLLLSFLWDYSGVCPCLVLPCALDSKLRITEGTLVPADRLDV